MQGFRHVLVALDLGPGGDQLTLGSRKAMGRAVWIARDGAARLTLLHSSREDEHWDAAAGQFVASGRNDAARRSALDEAVAEVERAGIETRLVVSDETAWMAVVCEVVRSGVDVVVAGKRTALHTDDRKLGTVARKLVRSCPCAVWLEDPRAESEATVILAATGLTPVGDRAVRLAAWVAAALGATLHVVHAYSLSMEAQLEGRGARREHAARMRASARDQIAGVLAGTPMADCARLHIGLTSPSQAIIECVGELRPGLVVMGTIARGGIPGLLMGNTAERLVDHIDCALLTIKPEDFVCPIEVDTTG